MLNRNIGCIEIIYRYRGCQTYDGLNRNIGCMDMK